MNFLCIVSLRSCLDVILFSMIYDMLAGRTERCKSNAGHILTFLG